VCVFAVVFIHVYVCVIDRVCLTIAHQRCYLVHTHTHAQTTTMNFMGAAVCSLYDTFIVIQALFVSVVVAIIASLYARCVETELLVTWERVKRGFLLFCSVVLFLGCVGVYVLCVCICARVRESYSDFV